MDMKVHYTSITVAAILRSAATQASLELALAPTMALRAEIANDFDLTTLRSLHGDVIFLDVDTANVKQMRTLTLFMGEAETGSVVVTSANLDVASMREFMRIGLADVLPQPFVGEDVANALQAASTGRRHVAAVTPTIDDDHRRGSVISFIKSGGGVGATSLAVQGAAALGREKNAPPLCVLDFDIQFGAAALQMDTEQRVSVIDLARDLKRLDGALLRGAMVRAHQRFDLLAAPSSIYPIGDLDVDAVATILEVARREYSQVMVDLPTLWTDWVLAALANSDVIVLVVQLTVPSLRQAKHQIQMLQAEHLDHIPLVVVGNRTASGFFGSKDIPLKNAAKALGHQIDHTIPDDAAMRLAADAGRPLNEVRAGNSLEKKIRLTVQAIAGKAHTSHIEPRRV
jgi:pilus assembly protein CpaE